MKKLHQQPISQSGFAMLFTVLLVSLILSIAVSISDLTLKQAVLSNLAKDSGIAFYQADAAVECGMYQDTTLGRFPRGATIKTGNPTDVPQSFTCGDTTMNLNSTESSSDHYVYQYPAKELKGNLPCLSIVFDKTDPKISKVQGLGFNVCAESPRRVERTLEVKY